MNNTRPLKFFLFCNSTTSLPDIPILPQRPTDVAQHFQHFTTISYILGDSERIRRVLNEAGLKVAMIPVKTIGNCLSSPKDVIQEHEKSQLVYKIPCADCEFVYVGQTKRYLNARVVEHKRAGKNQEPKKSASCEHLMLCDHRIN